MLFIYKKKTFVKKAKKILPDKEYFILDGEDVGSAVSSKKGDTISDSFTHCTSNGYFTPPRKLVNYFLDKGDKQYDPSKVEEWLEDYFDAKNTKIAMLSSVRAIFALMNNEKNPINEINIFVVLPNKVYKAMAQRFKAEYKKMFNLSFEFVFTEEDVEEDKSILTRPLSNKQINKILEKLEELEKKNKLNKDKDKKKKKDKSEDKKDKKKDKDKKKKKKKDKYKIDFSDLGL